MKNLILTASLCIVLCVVFSLEIQAVNFRCELNEENFTIRNMSHSAAVSCFEDGGILCFNSSKALEYVSTVVSDRPPDYCEIYFIDESKTISTYTFNGDFQNFSNSSFRDLKMDLSDFDLSIASVIIYGEYEGRKYVSIYEYKDNDINKLHRKS